jgi:hypothetical protein
MDEMVPTNWVINYQWFEEEELDEKKGNIYYIYFVPPNYYGTSYFPSVVTISLKFKKVESKWNRVNKMRMYRQKATNKIQLQQIRK